MNATAPQPELFPEEASPLGVVQVIAQVQVRNSGDRRAILAAGGQFRGNDEGLGIGRRRLRAETPPPGSGRAGGPDAGYGKGPRA
jgi:hypothetical protein